MKFFGCSDIGKRRTANQDTYLIDDSDGVYSLCAVFDGMGGVNGGAVASEIARDVFGSTVRNGIEKEIAEYGILTKASARRILNNAVCEANIKVYERGYEDSTLHGMGTTLVAVLFADENAYIINVGDSRLYGIYDFGIKQITKDHSYVQYLIDQGWLDERDANDHPQKNIITRSVGTDKDAEGDFYSIDFLPPYILLCSDGLSNQLDNDTIYGIITNENIPDELKAQELVRLANENGGKDNITVVLAVRS